MEALISAAELAAQGHGKSHDPEKRLSKCGAEGSTVNHERRARMAAARARPLSTA